MYQTTKRCSGMVVHTCNPSTWEAKAGVHILGYSRLLCCFNSWLDTIKNHLEREAQWGGIYISWPVVMSPEEWIILMSFTEVKRPSLKRNHSLALFPELYKKEGGGLSKPQLSLLKSKNNWTGKRAQQVKHKKKQTKPICFVTLITSIRSLQPPYRD